MSPDEILTLVEQSYRAYFEAEPARASVSFLGVEPMEVLRFESPLGQDEIVNYVSLGMARRPMTGGDELVVAEDGPRAELLLQCRGDGGDLWRQLAILASAPVVEGLIFSAGARVDLGTPLASGSRCTGAIVSVAELARLEFSGGGVEFLRLLPATANELAWARIHGSEALAERWNLQGVDLLDLGRESVQLD
ncbi:suppressor of fused domain protein [Jatrophihabitans sp. GAS493]|uniref:suppressor of fused domain protein n=1 Tax=Jatrophihabitans sp. GAS493 TaxID=1907575 RepID=UPI000BB69101|nr:suppressor of fused domain protein [Jatrophihabitans sp. GAS493]